MEYFVENRLPAGGHLFMIFAVMSRTVSERAASVLTESSIFRMEWRMVEWSRLSTAPISSRVRVVSFRMR